MVIVIQVLLGWLLGSRWILVVVWLWDLHGVASDYLRSAICSLFVQSLPYIVSIPCPPHLIKLALALCCLLGVVPVLSRVVRVVVKETGVFIGWGSADIHDSVLPKIIIIFSEMCKN